MPFPPKWPNAPQVSMLPEAGRESDSSKVGDIAFCSPAAPASTEVSEREKKNARWDLDIQPHVNCQDVCCNASVVVDYVEPSEQSKNVKVGQKKRKVENEGVE